MDTVRNDQDKPVEASRRDGITFLTLNRPRQYNALSSAMLDALHAAIGSAATDARLRVLVIAAAGPAFCAGHDLKEMQGQDDAGVARLFAHCAAMMQELPRLPVPVIAEVQGMATAAGCQLVAQCDLAIAADTARFAVSGVNLGLFCSTPAVPLSRAIGNRRALEMLMTGDFIDAATAREWGLVNRVVPAATLREATLALAAGLMQKPREALASGKALFYRQATASLASAYADASAVIAADFMSAAAQEGVAAFLEKRPPRWRD